MKTLNDYLKEHLGNPAKCKTIQEVYDKSCEAFKAYLIEKQAKFRLYRRLSKEERGALKMLGELLEELGWFI